ncbi:hypothetical protein P168DRAFT_319790 [Aspergillus campestris IBT 28561]|uniref:Uncharacterized protein n=1 Tax=Aspergillus campestris (strain IBT 28561) TaxID=1392248 RepID=A0A2I1D062_ASPC2|nr:uncharacterized protein P168DRAFT_319790 [Aspergillus campestris IBT 28561]PKY03261.1 hypothetical protein P168DRAFT_319790 [Aspergillus campestris IBT 28561]
MYSIELLPNSSSHATPGWTYVPDRRDRGFDPAKAAITPAVGRKRGIRDPGRADLSSRQNNAIVRHLAELDRENHKDVSIPIPVKQQKDASGRGTRGKVTSNVRRILQSQKTFRNHLDDEEAAQAQAAQTATQRPAPAQVSRLTKPSSSRRSSTPATASKPEPSSSRQKKHTTPATPSAVPTASTTASTDGDGDKPDSDPSPNPAKLITSEHDNDPLLRSYIPSAPPTASCKPSSPNHLFPTTPPAPAHP